MHSQLRLIDLQCERVLIASHADTIVHEFPNFLKNDKRDGIGVWAASKLTCADVELSYSLLKRVPNGTDPLRAQLELHLKKEGLAAIEKAGADAASVLKACLAAWLIAGQDAKLYVDALLAAHRQFKELVSAAFHADPSFLAALDKARFALRCAAADSPTGVPRVCQPQLCGDGAHQVARAAGQVL